MSSAGTNVEQPDLLYTAKTKQCKKVQNSSDTLKKFVRFL